MGYTFTPDFGWIEVICSGAMFAGKTKETFDRLDQFKWQGKSVILFKPCTDKRNSKEEVLTHNGHKMKACTFIDSHEILEESINYDVVAIEEAQFIKETIIQTVLNLRQQGKVVIINGLTLTSEGEPFGSMPHLMAIADRITTIFGICDKCGQPATKTKALFNKKEAIQPGGSGRYAPRCNECWED